MSIVLNGTKGINQNTTEVTKIPVGATAQRPENPETGMMRFNTDTDAVEVWNPAKSAWEAATDAETIAYDNTTSGLAATDVQDALDEISQIGFRLVETIYYTSSGTFQKGDYPWLRAIRVRVQGAGGGGGGAVATAAGNVSVGGGGSGGEYREVFLDDIAALSSSVTVTVGSGGSAGIGTTDATAGSKSIFGSVEAEGGGAGARAAGSSFPIRTSASGVGGRDGSGSADLTIAGQRGEQGIALVLGSPSSGSGGSSKLGIGGNSFSFATFSSGAGGTGFGSGGGGALNGESQATGRSGAVGRSGIVIVELYA